MTSVVTNLAKIAAAGALIASLPMTANAATIVYDLTGTDNSATAATPGNSATFTSGGVSVRATAWTELAGTVSDMFLGSYFFGIGAGASPRAIDNAGSTDFVLFQFDSLVTVDSVEFKSFFSGSYPAFDADATVLIGTSVTPYTTNLFSAGATFASVESLFSTSFDSDVSTSLASVTADRLINPSSAVGNLLLISARRGGDSDLDAFQLPSLTVTTAVPEPSTWAMMIGGFGAVGFGMRNRRAKATASFA